MTIDISQLKLCRTRERKEQQYDPHVHEEKCRKDAGQRPTPAITHEDNGTLFMDVIAKLEDREKSVLTLEVSRRPGKGQLVTGRAPVQDIEDIRKDPNVISLKAATEMHLCLYNSVPAIQCDRKALDENARSADGSLFPGLDGTGVVIGIVDTGADFRHKNFRHGNATRIHRIWDQAAEAGKPPEKFSYGREIKAEEINDALRLGDEGAFKALSYTPTIASHGTHVMDVSAGNGREEALFGGKRGPSLAPVEASHAGVAPNATLVFVHLKTHEGGFLGNSRQLLEAVEYIFEQADKLNMPAVVNLSLSTSGGPHDGSTLVEQGFEDLINEKTGRAIVISAGNSRLTQSHTAGTVSAGKPFQIRWYTDPRHTDPERTKNEMEVWYSGAQELTVKLRAPDGTPLPEAIRLGETWDLKQGDCKSGVRVGRISHRENDPSNHDHQIDIRLPHIEGLDKPWEIELSSENDDVPFHAWIEQDDRGLSRFETSKDSYTLSSISCSKTTVSVGAFDTSERACLLPPYEASSIGPTRPNEVYPTILDKPEVNAPGVGIVAARAHGGITVMTGTSMATAHVTGLVALLFQLAQRSGQERLSIDQTRDLLTQTTLKRIGPSLGSEDPGPADPKAPAGPVNASATAALQSLLNKVSSPPPRSQGAQSIEPSAEKPKGKGGQAPSSDRTQPEPSSLEALQGAVEPLHSSGNGSENKPAPPQ